MGRTIIGLGRIWSFVLLFDHSSRGSRHLRELEQRGQNFWQRKVWTHCDFQCHNGDQRRELREKRKVRIFGKGKCKLIANFSATMVTSLPSVSLSLSLSLTHTHRAHLTQNIGSASALPITTLMLVQWLLRLPLRRTPHRKSHSWKRGFRCSRW